MASHISYHEEDSCGKDDLLGFIKEIQDGIDNNKDAFDIEEDVLRRLTRCINDRFEYQNFFTKKTKISKITQDHINIIKVYYDFYVKLQRYFPIILILLTDKLVSIIQADYYDRHNNSYNHTLWLSFNKQKEMIPFTQVSEDPSYLLKLDFSEDFESDYNQSILNKYVPDWTRYNIWMNNPYVKDFEDILKEREQDSLHFRKSKRKSKKSRKSRKTRKTKSKRKSRKSKRKSKRKSRKSKRKSRKTKSKRK